MAGGSNRIGAPVILRNLLVSLLIPPFGFVTVAFVALLLQRRRPALGLGMCWAACLGLVVLATPAVSDTALVLLERNLPLVPPADDPPQAIIILGAEIIRTEGGTEPARVGALTLERLRAGAQLQRSTQLPILVTGGVTQPHMPPVGDLMAISLHRDFQVPVAWVENRSRDTWENATDSAAILRAHGIHSVYVVTHAWHMRRALIAFAHTGLVVTAAPTSLDRQYGLIPGDFWPNSGTWEIAYFALHEWIGGLWYEFRRGD
jgi:uncharacterized SAM-binding protein YcdF (DUF218 family)